MTEHPRTPADREAARRNTRARFEQWAKNPACQANTMSAVHNIRMSDVARHEGQGTTFGQSPFALARGNQFESSLFLDEGERLITELIAHDVLPDGASGLYDLRLRMNGGPRVTTLDQAIDDTVELLRRLATGEAVPSVAAAATVRIPRGVMLPEAVLIIDVLALRPDPPTLIVGEVKTYPDRGGYTNPGELASARAQAGLYVHALDLVATANGLNNALRVGTDGFLVLTRPGSNSPSVRAGEDLTFQSERARRGFEMLEAAALEIPDLWAGETEPEPDLLAAVQAAPTAYGEACLGFCDRTPTCHQRALELGDPAVLGDDVRRFLGDIDLHRVLDLLDGAPPVTPTETDLVERLVASDRLAGL